MERLLLTLVRAGLLLVPLTALAANDILGPDIIRSHVAWKSFSFRFAVEIVACLWLILFAQSCLTSMTRCSPLRSLRSVPGAMPCGQWSSTASTWIPRMPGES